MRRLLFILIILFLVACGNSAMTTQRVFDQLQRAGLATNARTAPAADGVIGGCGERLEFDIPGAAPGALGVIMVCPEDAPVELSAFGGAEVYRSAGGSVSVLVLGAPVLAPRIGEEVQRIPDE